MVRASFSPSVAWELNEVLRRDRRTRTAVLLVDDQGRPMQKSTYLRFREHVATECGIELPYEGWNCWYVWFDHGGQSRLIDAMSGEAGSGLEIATGELIHSRTGEAKAEWYPLSVWDLFIPLEYRILAWGPLTALAAILIICLFY